MNPVTIDTIWVRIDEWLMRHARDIGNDLNPPASRETVLDVERRIGQTLPADVTASFEIHDGQHGSAPWSFVDWRLLPTDLLVQQFELLRDLHTKGVFDGARARAHGPVRPVWWTPSWIPLLANDSGDYLCVDVDPPEGG